MRWEIQISCLGENHSEDELNLTAVELKLKNICWSRPFSISGCRFWFIWGQQIRFCFCAQLQFQSFLSPTNQPKIFIYNVQNTLLLSCLSSIITNHVISGHNLDLAIGQVTGEMRSTRAPINTLTLRMQGGFIIPLQMCKSFELCVFQYNDVVSCVRAVRGCAAMWLHFFFVWEKEKMQLLTFKHNHLSKYNNRPMSDKDSG